MKIFTRFKYTNSSVLIAAMMGANVLNFIFNAYLGRVLSFEQFGLVTIINTLYYLVNIFLAALGATIIHRVAFLYSKHNEHSAYAFFTVTRKYFLMFSFILTIAFLVASPFLQQFFRIAKLETLLFFSPVLILGLWGTANRSYLHGKFYFQLVAIATIVEVIVKLAAAIILVNTKNEHYVYTAIPISVLATAAVSQLLLLWQKIPEKAEHEHYLFPRRFFGAALIAGLASNAFLTLDVTLVKHFLSPVTAGQYSLLSLAGKIIFFLGSLLNIFTVTYVSRDLGQRRNPTKSFYPILTGITVLVAIGTIGLGYFGHFFMPILFGAKARSITPYLLEYSFMIAMYTIASAIVTFHLAKHEFVFPLVSIIMSVLMVAGIYFTHSNIQSVVHIMFLVSLANLVIIGFLHVMQKNGKPLLSNIIDLFLLFKALPKKHHSAHTKNILLFNWRDPKHSYAGGAEVYLHELAKRWVKKGHNVTWFCGNDGNTRRYEVVDGIEIIRRGGFYTVYIWAFIYYVFRFRKKYDVIIDCQNGVPFFTPLYVKEKVVAVMFHVHQDVFYRSLPRPLAHFAAILENRVMPWAYRRVKFITISESTKEEMRSWSIGYAGIEVIHPGIDINIFTPGLKHQNPLLLYVGRLKYYKTVNTFIRAAKQILDEMPHAEIVIAGDGDQRPGLWELAKHLNIHGKIKFMGKVTEQQKVDLYRKAWVFVNPSLMEGWGITNIEANACGTPVVAANVPGIRDSVRNPHNGFLVPHGDVSTFAQKIKLLLQDHKLRESMSANAIDWAKNFTWQKSAEKCLEVLL